ncbi:MAG TPA: DUF3090 family protein [Acidimicrobiales bacterium]|nr:DUF3090 family protein [Acidimicrobiales bacterium]
MSPSFDLSEVEWATVGTVGEPGHRTFFLQARQGDQHVTLKVEKQQVAALAQFIGEILSDLPAPESTLEDDALALVEPVSAQWAVGSIQLAYEADSDRIFLVAEEVIIEEGGGDEDDEAADPLLEPSIPGAGPPPDQGVARFGLTRAQAAALVRRGWDLVQAGRPACPLCGNPMDAEGHSCPRTNGHRPHAR